MQSETCFVRLITYITSTCWRHLTNEEDGWNVNLNFCEGKRDVFGYREDSTSILALLTVNKYVICKSEGLRFLPDNIVI
jgi:hypothetical protein